MGRKFTVILFVALLRAVAATWRIRLCGTTPSGTCVIAFWHGAMLPVWKFFSKSGAAAVVSRSRDGDILSALLAAWNYRLIRGSSSSGGRETLAAMTEAAATGKVLITPDGPRGPKCTAKAGAVLAAQRSATKLVCCRVVISRKILLNSWDSFAVPYPFARITIFTEIDAKVLDSNTDTAILSMQSLLGDWP
ncbi:hypothetical protein MASR2M18_01530 [Ignavibacteria bacterium]